MIRKQFRLEGTGPFVDESLAAMEIAHRDGDIRHVKETLASQVLKLASTETRTRAATAIVQRFLLYDKKTFAVMPTPWLAFSNAPFSREAKIKVLWYTYARGNLLYQSVLKQLGDGKRETFLNSELAEIATKLCGREAKGKAVDVIAASLRDFGFLRSERKEGKVVYRLIPNVLPFPAFAFVLYQHFLDQGTIVPKMSEVKEFFRNWYNQPEEETERLARTAPQGFWVIERMAHLDQLALVCASMDEVLKRLAEHANGNTRG
jgi:hypothetical protein